MNIRSRTFRRLLILFTATSVFVGLFICLIIAGIVHKSRTTARIRNDAMTAYQAGDYVRSVDLLQRYRDMAGAPDAEAEFAYGVSRIHVELPNGKHLVEGIHVFERYLQTMNPGDREAQRQLLHLYVARGYFAEALQLANELLAVDPRDGQALHEKALALVGRHEPAAALEVSEKFNAIEPLNWREQIITIMLLVQLNTPAEQVIGHAQKLLDDHADDPRFELVLAFAYSREHQDDAAVKWLKKAASRKAPDALFVADLASRLDENGQFVESDAFLKRSADEIADVAAQRMFAERLWEDGKIADLLERLKDQTPQSPKSDGVLMAYRAQALYADAKPAEAKALVAALSQRADGQSAAWAMGLQSHYCAPPLSASDLASRLAEAVARDPQNPSLHMMLAEAYLRMSESDLAIQQCAMAAQRAKSWFAPYLMMAEAQTTTGRQAEAVESARQALDRAPNRYETRLMRARTFFAWANESGLASDYTNLLTYLEQMQQTYHDAQTLPMYVTVMARTGHREQAVKEVQAAIAADPPLPAETLTRIAEACDDENLGLGAQVRDMARKIQGISPEMSLSQARAMLKAGQGAQGMAFLLAEAKGHENAMSWRIAIALYREALGQDEAIRDWVALGDQYPADLQLQQTILRAQSRMRNRPFWERTIERVKAVTGEQGVLWRVERSRWLLAGPLTERDKAEAVNLLTQVAAASPGLAEPHRLLALALEKVNNVTGAIAELTAAADAHPGDPTITRELVRLLLANDRTDDAVAYLDKLAGSRELTVEARTWLARTYAEHGYFEKAVGALSVATNGTPDLERDRLLAELLRRAGHNQQAGELYWNLLEQPIVDPIFWAQGADFFASQGDMTKAERFLARLVELPLHPGDRETLRGQFAERWQGREEALKHYEAATKGAPTTPGTWAALAEFQIRHQQDAEAIATTAVGLRSVPRDDTLTLLAQEASTLQKLSGQELQPLRDALGADPRDAGAVQVLAEFSRAQTGGLPPAETARQIATVCGRFPHNPMLQAQAVKTLNDAGLTESALQFAQRAADANPHDGWPQRLLADIYVRMGNWTLAEKAALLWRRRAPDQAQFADILLAQIYLSQPKKNPAAAVEVLKPYAGPSGGNLRAIELFAKALILADRSAEARSTLAPHLAESVRWRAIWLDLASQQKDTASAQDWIEQAMPSVPKDSATEQCALAKAWYSVGVRFDSSWAFDSAAKILAPFTSGSADVPQAWVLTALIAQAREDYNTAEAAYRKVLAREPHSADCLNDLAYVLWLRGRETDLPEARRLAESAVALRPNDASLYDTLARIQAKFDPKLAIATFRVAIEKDPSSVEVRIGLADLLSRDPAGRDEARALIAVIQHLMNETPHLSSTLRKQYQNTKEALASSQ